MGTASKRLETRNDARNALDQLFKQPSTVNVIHYSCESFYDRPEGTSPRVTSIAVRNLGSGQTTSFSIHQVAEKQGYSQSEIADHYDQLEYMMLESFYAYVRIHVNDKWIHWNMRDINYGFPALEHRFTVLKGNPAHIPDPQLIDLASKLVDIYGRSYAPHPRLENIMEINSITHLHFLPGREEAKAFENKEYVKLHQSTLKEEGGRYPSFSRTSME